MMFKKEEKMKKDDIKEEDVVEVPVDVKEPIVDDLDKSIDDLVIV